MISPSAARVGRLAFAYFASVFSIGFALGVVRTLWILPRLGPPLSCGVARATADIRSARSRAEPM
jgi:hypothetical protein